MLEKPTGKKPTKQTCLQISAEVFGVYGGTNVVDSIFFCLTCVQECLAKHLCNSWVVVYDSSTSPSAPHMPMLMEWDVPGLNFWEAPKCEGSRVEVYQDCQTKVGRTFKEGKLNCDGNFWVTLRKLAQCCPSWPGQQLKFPLLKVETQGSFLFHFPLFPKHDIEWEALELPPINRITPVKAS